MTMFAPRTIYIAFTCNPDGNVCLGAFVNLDAAQRAVEVAANLNSAGLAQCSWKSEDGGMLSFEDDDLFHGIVETVPLDRRAPGDRRR